MQNDYECYAHTDARVAEAIAASTKRQQRSYFAGGKWKSVNKSKATTSSPVIAKPSKVKMTANHTIKSTDTIKSKAKSVVSNTANTAPTNAATASATSSPKATIIIDLTASATSSPKATIIIDLTVPLEVGDKSSLQKGRH